MNQSSRDDFALDKSSMPANLYELLGVPADAQPSMVKKAYYEMQKICHPDVAGEDGEEMCILLNDAYDVLASEGGRSTYDQQLEARRQVPDHLAMVPADLEEPESDLGPTWSWAPKRHKQRPIWNGRPRSRNCCDVAPRTFCIDAESGRARVYAQWGDGEEYLEYALAACPVDCISWVSREQLQRLEFVTAETIYDKGPHSLPCPMALRQGTYGGPVDNPFTMAEEFASKQKKREERARKILNGLSASRDAFAGRIGQAISRLPPRLLGKIKKVWQS